MKKLFVLLLTACLICGLSACGKETENAGTAQAEPGTEAVEQEVEEPGTAGEAPAVEETMVPEEAASEAEVAASEPAPLQDALLVGGWTIAESPAMNEERQAILDKALADYRDEKPTAVAYIGSQIVSGTNHAYVCRMPALTEGGAETYAIAVIYEDLSGNCIFRDLYASDAETSIYDGENLAGGWTQAADPTVTEDVREALAQALEGITGAQHPPVAVLATQVVAGTNYAILCEVTPVVPNPESHPAIVFLYVGVNGEREILNVFDFRAVAG